MVPMFCRSSFAGEEARKCLALCDEADNLVVALNHYFCKQRVQPNEVLYS